MQLLKELTRAWQLESCYQNARGFTSKRNSPECDSWTAGISQAGLEEGCPIMQLLKELTRVCQLDSCYQPGWAREGSPIMQLLKGIDQ
jgi:hypothetical protein